MNSKKLVLFNCSTNVIGGGVKNSYLFILRALKDDTFLWLFAISPQVAQLLRKDSVVLDFRFCVFEKSPARSKKARQQLKSIVKMNNVAMVFTMAGPAYVSFSCSHVQGISNAYITHADLDAFKLKGNVYAMFRYMIYVAIQLFFARKADYFIFQTEQARSSFIARAGISKQHSFVVSNAIDDNHLSYPAYSAAVNGLGSNPFRIFCPGADYAHKGFQLIPKIAFHLKKRTLFPFKFILTLPDSVLYRTILEMSRSLGVTDCIENIGPYSYTDAAELYTASDVVFVPSLLETFSASYLEAMVSNRVLVVANKPFARDICGTAAIYCDPKNPVATAEVFDRIFNAPDVYQFKGCRSAILRKFGNQDERFKSIRKILKNISEKQGLQ